jgi:hypothetical protein
MPTIGGGDDFVWIGGPCEGLWLLVAVGDHRVQALAISRAQIDGDASTHPADSHDAKHGNPNKDVYVGINPLEALKQVAGQ